MLPGSNGGLGGAGPPSPGTPTDTHPRGHSCRSSSEKATIRLVAAGMQEALPQPPFQPLDVLRPLGMAGKSF
ncbi:UNVERIFIED_CONTAM: hypothetical protein K2H54_013331 [Gekko kuhli]